MEPNDLEFPYQATIDENRDVLCKAIVVERYVQSLRQCNALSQEDCDEVTNRYVYQTSQQRAARFLDILYTKGPSAYSNFLDVLEFENGVVYERLTSKKARKPTPEYMAGIKKSRGSVVIPHLAAMAKSLEDKHDENKTLKEELQEMQSLIDTVNVGNRKLEDESSVLSVKFNKLKHKYKAQTADNKYLRDQIEMLHRDKDVLWKSCLESKRETNLNQERCQQYMLERDAANKKYNQLKQENDSYHVDVSKFKEKWNFERERSVRLQKNCERAPKQSELETLRTENDQLKHELSQLKSSPEPLRIQTSDSGIQDQHETQIAILQDQLQEYQLQCSQQGVDLCDTNQRLHDAEVEVFKASDRLLENELQSKNFQEVITTYKEQGEDLRSQLKKIKLERDEAIAQRNKAQNECGEKLQERDLLAEEKHGMQTTVDRLNGEIKTLRYVVEKMEKQLKSLGIKQMRISSDSGEFSMEKSCSEYEAQSGSSDSSEEPEDHDYFDMNARSSMIAHVSASMKRDQHRCVDEDEFLENNNNAIPPESSCIPKLSQMHRAQSAEEHRDHIPKTRRSMSLPCNSIQCLTSFSGRNHNWLFPERKVTVPASFLQDYVEIRGEILIGLFIVCANTTKCQYDVRRKDQVLQIEYCDSEGNVLCLNLLEHLDVTKDKVHLIIMSARPDSDVTLTLVYNPTGYQHLKSVTERVKPIEDPFFIQSNITLSEQAEGHLDLDMDSLLKVLHNALPRTDKSGKAILDGAGKPVYDWFACKIDRESGDADQFGLIPSEEEAAKLMNKKKHCVLQSLAQPTLSAIGYDVTKRPYRRLQRFKKLLVLYGPPDLKDKVVRELQDNWDFKECQLENVLCSVEELGIKIMDHEVLHYVKCGSSNFSVISTKAVKEIALNYFCIADISLDDIETFTSRLQQAGLGINVVVLRPSTTVPPDTLWNDVFLYCDVQKEIANSEMVEAKLRTCQSHDAVNLASVEIQTTDDLLAKIVQICNYEPWSKMALY